MLIDVRGGKGDVDARAPHGLFMAATIPATSWTYRCSTLIRTGSSTRTVTLPEGVSGGSRPVCA